MILDDADLSRLLIVAQLYLDAFMDDEAMTLPERLQLAEVERIVREHAPEPSDQPSRFV